MTLLREYRVASLLLVILSIVAFSIAELDFAMLFIGVVLAVLSWYVTEGPRGRTLPGWAANILTVGLLASSVIDFVVRGTIEGAMGSLGRFLLWLLVIKLFARRADNEDSQRFTLATMLVLIGCLESVELVFGLLVLAYAGLAAWTAMLWRLSKGAEAARASRERERGFAPPLEIAFGRRASPQLHRLAAAALLSIFCLSIVGFFAFPRLQNVRFGEGAMGAVTGFSDEIDLRGGDRITESRRELFTLQWFDPSGEAVQSARPLLLRGAVLDSYDIEDQRWYARRSSSALNTVRTMSDGQMLDLTGGAASDARGRYRARIELRAVSGEVLFTPYAPVAIATSDPRTVSVDRGTLILKDISVDPGGRLWFYEMLVQQQPDTATLAGLTDGVRAQRPARGVGFPVAEIEPIARGILTDVSRTSNIPAEPAPDADPSERWTRNREVARAIASWMKSTFTYTTDLSAFGRIPGEDPIVSFLTRYRSGHCEYFASALCAVLRSLGIESRIVTGFIAMEYDERAQHYVVRDSNAHAWVEVRTGERGWTAVDATPEESLFEIQERNRSVADRFRWIYSRLEFLWNSGVVAYDSTSQQSIASRVESGWREAMSARLEAIVSRMRTIAISLSLGAAGGVWFAVIGVGTCTAGLALLIAALRRRRLRAALRVDRLPSRDRVRIQRDAAFYIEALRALRAAGVEKPEHCSPRAFADQLEARNKEVGAAFRTVAEAYYQVRYGGLLPDRTQANAHLSAVSRLRELLRHNSRTLRVD